MTVEEIAAKVNSLLQIKDIEDITLSQPEVERFVRDAIIFHSKDSPREIVADINGDGSYDYDLPATFLSDYSFVNKIEYPQGDRFPVFIDESAWVLYKSPTATKLRFLDHTPATGEVIRVIFTSPWLTTTIDEMSDSDVAVFCYLVASFCCLSLSSRYSQIQNSNIEGDIVDYSDLAKNYRNMGKDFKDQYERSFGSGGQIPTSLYVEHDVLSNPFIHDRKLF